MGSRKRTDFDFTSALQRNSTDTMDDFVIILV